MTNKPRTKKTPSPAELKRQLAAEKQKATAAKASSSEAMGMIESLAGTVKTVVDTVNDLSGKIDAMNKPAEVHDRSSLSIKNVLREPDDDYDDIPEKPLNELPSHLRVSASNARNNPSILRETLQTDQEEVGQIETRAMSSTGPARDSISEINYDDGIILENGKIWSKEKYEIEQFMHEYVFVRMPSNSDDNITSMPQSINGGISQYFQAGSDQWVRRKFLEPLLRAKRTTYDQKTVTADNGDQSIEMVPVSALIYHFEILKDTEKGKHWARQILREP